MTVYLGLGSNQGNRLDQLEWAVRRLVRAGFRLARVSPVVESPAMLPSGAKGSWDCPYLNLVVAGETRWSPRQTLTILQAIEREAGRQPGPRWSPRPLDIDILLWGEEHITEPDLVIPHPGLAHRDFVITPLVHIAPGQVIPGIERTVFELSLGRRNIPLWMGVINLTPDSFSDGGSWEHRGRLTAWIDRLMSESIQIIDVGAESTRPHAKAISVDEEWRRLQPVLALLNERLQSKRVRPWVSLDSRHPAIVEKGLAQGVDLVNDVTGLDDPAMVSVVRRAGCDVVAMHAMTVPVDPAVRLADSEPAIGQLLRWIEQKKSIWADQGMDTDRIIFDPGIGFGKSSLQALELMSDIRTMRESGLRVLIGHSRKSFMSSFMDHSAEHRDFETLGISLALADQGVDIIRVHDPLMHQRAYRAWRHVTRHRSDRHG